MASKTGAREARAGARLPGGTVSLLMTDIEGSTRLLRRVRGAYAEVLAEHSRLVVDAIAGNGGRVVDSQGDAVFAAFPRARQAVAAAVAAQRALAGHAWPEGVQVRVRMGVHTGEPELRAARYVGLDVHRVARICAAAHGGQVLVSAMTAGLVEDELPADIRLRPVGEVRLKDLPRPERLWQLVVEGLPSRFPPPRVDTGTQPFAGTEEALARELAAPGSTVQVGVLGPVQVRRDGRAVMIGAAKQRMILAVLALRYGEAVSADRLIDALWGGRPPATAQKALHVYVSELRKLIEPIPGTPHVIVSQHPGYVLAVAPEAIDVRRFEQLWETGREYLASGDPDRAATVLGDALGLWRGAPLADFTYEAALAGDIRRLEEMQLACHEDAIDARLACGHHAQVIPELERLVREYPLRERLSGQLMLALYRAGRQAEALAVYRTARDALRERLGLAPSSALARLERQILQQDKALDLPERPRSRDHRDLRTPRSHTMLVVSQASSDVEELLAVAEPLVDLATEDLILARPVITAHGHDQRDRLREITRRLAEHRDRLQDRGVNARVAAFSSSTPAVDLLKLATHQDAALILLDGTRELIHGRSTLADELLAGATADVALHLPTDHSPPGEAILVPFGGSEHDWAALELATCLAKRTHWPLLIAGTQTNETDARDASRLLANSSLIVQRTTRVTPEPILIPPGADAILDAANEARIVVIGLSVRYHEEGLGATRYAIARNAPAPSLFVRRGTRPGLLAPADTMTRFAWSITQTDG